MDLKSTSSRRCRGEVTLQLCHKGKVVETIKPNLVVNQAYDIMATWAAQNFAETISYIAVGDGGNVPGDPTIPIPPTESDVALVNEIDQKLITSITQPTANSVEYIASFLPGEGVGALSEAGLFTNNNRLFARVTFGVITKGALTLIVRWKITF